MLKGLKNLGKSVVSGIGGAISKVVTGSKSVVGTAASAISSGVTGAIKGAASGGGVTGAIAGAIEGVVTGVAGGAVTPKPASVPASVFDVETQPPVVMDIQETKSKIDTVAQGLKEVSDLLRSEQPIIKKPISLDYSEWVPYITDWEKWKKG